jgi:hypothetical protein
MTVPQMLPEPGPIAMTVHELDAILIKVPIGYAFVEIVTGLKTCHIYKGVLQTI